MKHKKLRPLRFAATTAAIAAAMSPLQAQAANLGGWYGHMDDGWDHMMGWGSGVFFGFGMIIFWAVVIVLVALLARSFWGSPPPASQPGPPGSTALDILKVRYARGEIDKEEYEERRTVLSQ